MLTGLRAPANQGSQNMDSCPPAHLGEGQVAPWSVCGLHDSVWMGRMVFQGPWGQAQGGERESHPT